MFARSLIGTALGALAWATAAQAQVTATPPSAPASVVTPAYGNIDPFYGNIDPFYGNIDPFYGNIDPFYGNIDPFYGNIDPFYGNIDPFYGNIDVFWKDINPFYGNIDPFWRDLNPYYGNIDPFYGNIDPFYGNIDPFWGNLDPFYGNIDPFRGTAPAYKKIGDYWKGMGSVWTEANQQWASLGAYADDTADYEKLLKSLNALVDRSEATWGAAVTAKTGKSFRAGFADALFARYGINLNDPATLDGLTEAQRAHFFIAWYDGLMNYSGRDHLDYWMGLVNWSPALTRFQGGGSRAIVGLLDSTVVNDPDIANNIIYTGGYTNPLAGHGTSVSSLMVSAHDGRGLMGIAPNAAVAAYNPFDGSNTASWADVKSGILALKSKGASVINMSLGVNGATLHQDWNALFSDPAIAATRTNTVFVLAAGNEGRPQTDNIAWNSATDPRMIVVGSVDPSGQISRFSNTPGQACLLTSGSCNEANRLHNRFIVAPGEAILVSDGHGGLVRRSGTSFAAPLVSGAIALLHGRWPWLANNPDETVDIVLRSAKDLGTPGPDAVYGWGMLDVRASQSPLNFNNLIVYEYRNGLLSKKTPAAMRAGGVKPSWEAANAFVVLFEPIGDTYRDFLVPLSSRLVGLKVRNGTGSEYFQSYLTSRFVDWIKTGKLAGGSAGFSDVDTAAMAPIGDLHLSFSATPSLGYGAGVEGGRAPHSMIRLSDAGSGLAVTAGYGEGALALGGARGFGLASDHHSGDGGVNPLLGFASGGPFASVDFKFAPRWSMSAGLTRTRMVHSRLAGLGKDDRLALEGLDPYRATALTVGVSHEVGSRLTLDARYTRLDEQAAVLGVQSLEPGDLGKGSASDAATLSASAALGDGIQLSLSATAARTRAGDRDQAFTTDDGGVISSAFAIAAAKTGIVGKRDQLRLSVAQPLHIERGAMAFTSIQVVDRATGEIGPVTQKFDISGQDRRYLGELLYAAPLLDDSGELSLFGRAQLGTGETPKIDNYVVGGRVKFAF